MYTASTLVSVRVTAENSRDGFARCVGVYEPQIPSGILKEPHE